MQQKPMSHEELQSLWISYSDDRDVEKRNKLVEHYLPLVNLIAGRMAITLPEHVDTDDLKVSGYFGLMDAVSKFDYTRGNKFETYASRRISGEMLDHLRSCDWISVSLRQKIRRYEAVRVSFEGKNGRAPTAEDMAQEMDMTLVQVRSLEKQINASVVIPLGEYIKNETVQSSSDPAGALEKIELKEMLAEAIGKLNDKERLVVALYYHEGLTMKEISKTMELSEARICQLHKRAASKLRGLLAIAQGGVE